MSSTRPLPLKVIKVGPLKVPKRDNSREKLQIGENYLEVAYKRENLDPTSVRLEIDQLLTDIEFNLDQLVAAAQTQMRGPLATA